MVSIPPPKTVVTPLNSKTLFLFLRTGWRTASPLLPPSNFIDNTSSISNSCLSTWISLISPVTTGLTSASVDPNDTFSIWINGGFITS